MAPVSNRNQYTHHYYCVECDECWTRTWSCACNDECPKCGVTHIPHTMETNLPETQHTCDCEGGCQSEMPDLRPLFEELVSLLDDVINNNHLWDYEDFPASDKAPYTRQLEADAIDALSRAEKLLKELNGG